MSLGVATSLTSKLFETMLSSPAWISWLCNPHAPPISMQLRHCSPHVPQTMPRMRPTLPRRQASLSSFGTAPRRCSDGVSHASDVASPASVSRPWWWARSGTAAIVQAELTSPSPFLASDGGLKQFVELPHAIVAASLIACRFQRHQRHSTHVVAVLPANISGLSR